MKNVRAVLLILFVVADWILWNLFDASADVNKLYLALSYIVRVLIVVSVVHGFFSFKLVNYDVKIAISYVAIMFFSVLYSGVPGRIPGLDVPVFNLLWFWKDPLQINKALKGAMLLFYFVSMCLLGVLIKNEKEGGVK